MTILLVTALVVCIPTPTLPHHGLVYDPGIILHYLYAGSILAKQWFAS